MKTAERRRAPRYGLVLSLSLWAISHVHAAPSLNVGSQAGLPGTVVNVSVAAAGLSGVTAFQFDLSFDPAVLLPQEAILAATLPAHLVVSNPRASNSVRVIIYSPADAPLKDGALVTVPFLVSPSAAFGSSSLPLANVILSDAQGNQVTPGALTGGAISIMSAAAARLTAITRALNGDVTFQLIGSPGQSYIIQASRDLILWPALSTNVVISGSILISDPGAKNFPFRFYRAVQEP